MPTCPGCSRTVSYVELKTHTIACKWVWSERPEAEGRWSEHLSERLRLLDEGTPAGSYLDRLEERMDLLDDR